MGKTPQEEFDDVISQLSSLEDVSAGVAFHQLFTTFMAGGFTEDQALKLLAFMFTANNPETPTEE